MHWILCLASFIITYIVSHSYIQNNRINYSVVHENVLLLQLENKQDMIFNAKLTIIREQTSRNSDMTLNDTLTVMTYNNV